MNEYGEITTDILNNETFFDRRCWHCDGGTKTKEDTPNSIWWDENGICERCKGTGYIPTELGESIIAFFERHIKGK